MKIKREKVWMALGGPRWGWLQWRILWLAHQKYIIGVSGLVRNDAGQALLIKHRMWKPTRPWGTPTGYANRGEDFADTVVREVREELGLKVRTVRMANINSGFKLRVEICYLAEFVGGTLTLDPKEALEARWFDIDDLPEGLLPAHRKLIEEHRSWYERGDHEQSEQRADAEREDHR